MTNQLPPFPVDNGTLDLLWMAIYPGEHAERSSVSDFLQFMAAMGGSDVDAVAEVVDGMHIMRDQAYHVNNVLEALITEIRRLRGSQT